VSDKRVAIECLNGTTVYGELVAYSRGHFQLRMPHGTLAIPQNRVKRIIFGKKRPSPARAWDSAGSAARPGTPSPDIRGLDNRLRDAFRSLDSDQPDRNRRFLEWAYEQIKDMPPDAAARVVQKQLRFLPEKRRPVAAVFLALAAARDGDRSRAELILQDVRRRHPSLASLVDEAMGKVKDLAGEKTAE